jgi:REP element-mobilizing transposase RayT
MRKPRVLVPDGIYHASARVNRKEMLLEKKEEKKHFLDVIRRAKDKYSFHLMNFSIMGNHFHFIIKPTNGSSLSRILQWIESVYAMDWNRRHGTTGHFWGERFHSRVIIGHKDLAKVMNYVDENPVRAGLAKKASDWEFSGLHHFLTGQTIILSPISRWIRCILSGCHPIMIPFLP